MGYQLDIINMIENNQWEKLQGLEFTLESLAEVNNLKEIRDYFRSLGEDECTSIVSKAGMLLAFVGEQTDEMALAAVKENGFALEFVLGQTTEICEAAVIQNPFALKHTITQNVNMCMGAVEADTNVLPYVREHLLENKLTIKYFPRNGFRSPKGRIYEWKDQLVFAMNKQIISREEFDNWFNSEKDRMTDFYRNGYEEFLNR